jgi:hypothetical protein
MSLSLRCLPQDVMADIMGASHTTGFTREAIAFSGPASSPKIHRDGGE